MKTGPVDLGPNPTPDDLLKLAREAVKQKDEVPEAVIAPPASFCMTMELPDAPEPIEEPAAPIFDRSQLYQPLANRCQWYTMPGGGRVCVHPPSGAEILWAQKHVLAELRRGNLLDGAGEVKKGKEREFMSEATTRGQVWTALAVCRAGEDLASSKIFQPEDAAAFLSNPAWAVAAEEIYAISVTLAQGESESAALRKLLAVFFDKLGSWLETLSGQSDVDRICSQLSRSASCVSSAKPLESMLPALIASFGTE